MIYYISCPYCDFVNKVDSVHYTRSGLNTDVICCDSEEGGCDKQFAIKIKLIHEIFVSELYFHKAKEKKGVKND